MSDVTQVRDRLMLFYSVYAPEKADPVELETVARRYFGREDELFERLVAKYGPEPKPMGSSAARSDAGPTSASAVPMPSHYSNVDATAAPPHAAPEAALATNIDRASNNNNNNFGWTGSGMPAGADGTTVGAAGADSRHPNATVGANGDAPAAATAEAVEKKAAELPPLPPGVEEDMGALLRHLRTEAGNALGFVSTEHEARWEELWHGKLPMQLLAFAADTSAQVTAGLEGLLQLSSSVGGQPQSFQMVNGVPVPIPSSQFPPANKPSAPGVVLEELGAKIGHRIGHSIGQVWQKRYFMVMPPFVVYSDQDPRVHGGSAKCRGALYLPGATVTEGPTLLGKPSIAIDQRVARRPASMDPSGQHATVHITFDNQNTLYVWRMVLSRIAGSRVWSAAHSPRARLQQQQRQHQEEVVALQRQLIAQHQQALQQRQSQVVLLPDGSTAVVAPAAAGASSVGPGGRLPLSSPFSAGMGTDLSGVFGSKGAADGFASSAPMTPMPFRDSAPVPLQGGRSATITAAADLGSMSPIVSGAGDAYYSPSPGAGVGGFVVPSTAAPPPQPAAAADGIAALSATLASTGAGALDAATLQALLRSAAGGGNQDQHQPSQSQQQQLQQPMDDFSWIMNNNGKQVDGGSGNKTAPLAADALLAMTNLNGTTAPSSPHQLLLQQVLQPLLQPQKQFTIPDGTTDTAVVQLLWAQHQQQQKQRQQALQLAAALSAATRPRHDQVAVQSIDVLRRIRRIATTATALASQTSDQIMDAYDAIMREHAQLEYQHQQQALLHGISVSGSAVPVETILGFADLMKHQREVSRQNVRALTSVVDMLLLFVERHGGYSRVGDPTATAEEQQATHGAVPVESRDLWELMLRLEPQLSSAVAGATAVSAAVAPYVPAASTSGEQVASLLYAGTPGNHTTAASSRGAGGGNGGTVATATAAAVAASFGSPAVNTPVNILSPPPPPPNAPVVTPVPASSPAAAPAVESANGFMPQQQQQQPVGAIPPMASRLFTSPPPLPGPGAFPFTQHGSHHLMTPAPFTGRTLLAGSAGGTSGGAGGSDPSGNQYYSPVPTAPGTNNHFFRDGAGGGIPTPAAAAFSSAAGGTAPRTALTEPPLGAAFLRRPITPVRSAAGGGSGSAFPTPLPQHHTQQVTPAFYSATPSALGPAGSGTFSQQPAARPGVHQQQLPQASVYGPANPAGSSSVATPLSPGGAAAVRNLAALHASVEERLVRSRAQKRVIDEMLQGLPLTTSSSSSGGAGSGTQQQQHPYSGTATFNAMMSPSAA